MSTQTIRTPKTALALAAALALLPMQDALAASCTWNTTAGNWAALANWATCVAGNGSPAGVPGAADTATIGATGLVTINTGQNVLNLGNAGQINIDAFGLNLVGGGGTTNTGTINVGSGVTANLGVSAGHNVNNAGGVINVANGSVVNQFGSTITGGTINTTGSGALMSFVNASNYLRGVTLNGSLDAATNGGQMRIANGFTLTGTVSVNNGGYINLEGTQSIGGSGSFVFGATGNNRLGVDGGNITTTLGANIVVRGQTGTIGVGSLVNGSGNTLLNLGTISADSGGIISIAGATLANQNIVEAIGAGSVLRLDTNVTNTGGTLRSLAGGVVLQNGVTVTGGNISNSGGGSFRAANNGNNFLGGVTLTAGSQIDLASATSLERVIGGMTLNGTVSVNNGSLINFEGDQTLGGSGSIVFGSVGNNRVGIDGGNRTLTVASGVTIRGENGSIGLGQLVNGSGNTLVNNGTIAADVAGGTITLAQSPVTNNGTIRADNGGTIALQSNLTGGAGSQLAAGAGSVISQQGVTISGVVNTSGSGNLRPVNSGNNFLSAVTLNGSLDMASAVSLERVVGNLVLNGTINVDISSLLNFEGDQALSGNGTIIFGATGNNRVGIDGGNKTLTVASGMTIRGQNGSIGLGQLVNGSGNTLINNGTISADVAGGTITLAQSPVTNNGTIRALNGGTLQLQSNLVGSPGGQLVAGAGSVISQQGVTISGVINTSGSGNLRPTNSGNNILSGVTLNGNLDLASAAGFEYVTNNLVLNGTININNTSVLNFLGNQTLSGNGSIVFGATAANNRVGVDGGNKILTIANGVTIRGQNGTIGLGQFINGSGNTLVNQGLISSDSGGTINVGGATFANQSFAEAVGAGSVLRLDGDVTNTAGTLRSTTGGVVLQNGVVVTGGNITNSGTATYRLANSGNNYLSGVTLTSGSTIDMASAASFVRVINGMTVNGTFNIDASSVVNMEGTQTLAGSGSIVFGSAANNRLGVDGGNKTLTIASGVTIQGVNGLVGQGQFVNGSGNAIINNGTINSDGGGVITIQALDNGLTNTGLLRAQSGTLNVSTALSGTGTLQVDAAGIMNLANGAKTQGTLTMGAAGSALNMGSGNLTITNDYTNAAAGTGNSFARRTGVTGTGQIVAAANAAQAITGTSITGGNTANATLTIGNVRVGANNFDYQIANVGATGPTLRGAIQTNVNGANLNDVRLTGGSGITPTNYNAGAPGGNSGNLAVVFNPGSAGLMPALTGQVLNLRSNFENIADQKLNIVLAAGAAAYNRAGHTTTPAPVTMANQRVGGTLMQDLTTTNTAPAGLFSEALNASFASFVGQAINNGGAVTNLIAGGSNVGAMKVGVDTTTAGAKTGQARLTFESDGTGPNGNSGLAAVSAGIHNFNVIGNVYQAAQPTPAALPSVVNLGNFRAGAGAQAAPGIVVTNTNLAPTGFQEGLAAAILSTSGQATGTGFSNAVAGGNGTLNVGLSGINAGANTGSVNVQLRSNGIATTGDTGLGNLDLGAAQAITVNASGYRLAAPNTIAAVNFGNVLANSVQTRTLTISNQATADGFSEALNAAFGVFGGTNAASFSGAGAIAGLLAGGSNNTSMVVTLNTSLTGAKTANVQVLLDSNGTAIGNGLGLTALPTQTINLDGLITANVGNLATAGLNPTTVNFGKFREGAASQTQQLTVSNLTQGPGEGLNASFGAATGSASNNAGSITSLPTGGSNNTAMSVTLSGLATAGAKSGTQVLNFVSDGSFNNQVPTPLPSQSVTLSADAYRLATAGVNTPINLAARRVGEAAATGVLTLANTAATDGFSEGLRGTFGAAPSGFAVSGAASTGLIAAGAAEPRNVSLSTATAGSFGGNLTIALVSNGAGTSGFGDAPLADRVVALSGKVYTPAVGQLATPSVNFGVVRVGDTVTARNITINNTAAATALNDTLTANLSGAASPFSGGGSASGITAQGSGQIAVGLATTTAGTFNVNASVAFTSRNPDMADASAGANAGVNLLATINNLANADFDLLLGLGVLTQNGSNYVLDLGNIALGSSIVSKLRLDNDVLGPADVLSGDFNLIDINDFSYQGWGAAVGPLAAGQATGDLEIDYLASALGQFQDSIVFNGRGTNASDAQGLAQTRTLIIRANVFNPDGNPVPEPGSLALMLAAAVAAALVRRRRAAMH